VGITAYAVRHVDEPVFLQRQITLSPFRQRRIDLRDLG